MLQDLDESRGNHRQRAWDILRTAQPGSSSLAQIPPHRKKNKKQKKNKKKTKTKEKKKKKKKTNKSVTEKKKIKKKKKKKKNKQKKKKTKKKKKIKSTKTNPQKNKEDAIETISKSSTEGRGGAKHKINKSREGNRKKQERCGEERNLGYSR